MIRFSRRRERLNAEGGGWELSFADMMTLILCFFILVVSVSEVDDSHYETVARSLGEAMSAPPPEGEAAMPDEVRVRLRTLRQIHADLARRVGPANAVVELSRRDDAVAVNLHGAVLFDSGSAELTPLALRALENVAPVLVGIPYRVTVEGHTDDNPIRSQEFPSNWELSAARASAVARYLIDKGFPKDKLQVKGLADTRPVAPNRDAQGRAIEENQMRNRRIVILVAPAAGERNAPAR